MSGIALFVSNEEMSEQVQEILKEKEHHVVVVKRITIEGAVTEAQEAISEGVNIAMACGRQVVEIRHRINMAVAEIMMTAQELSLLVMRAKDIVGKECPRIGIFGWGDTFRNTTYFNELYHVDSRRYILKDRNEWRSIIEQAVGDELDIIIGGEAALKGGRQAGIPGIYMASAGEILRLAPRNAESLYYMPEIEQHNYAQFSTILDSSFNGVIEVGVSGKVLVMDRTMEQILDYTQEEAMGQLMMKLPPGLDEAIARQALDGELNNYSILLTIGEQFVALPAESIVMRKRVGGAIFSCGCLKRLDIRGAGTGTKQYLRGYVVYGAFGDINRNLGGMKKAMESAKLYAQSSSPMLVEAISGPGLDAVAREIHNYSTRRNSPFIMTNMAGLIQEKQKQALSGYPGTGRTGQGSGMLEKASHRALVIQGTDKLTLPDQYQLACVTRIKRLSKNGQLGDTQMIDVKIITCTTKNLTELRSSLQLRLDLYFTLKSPWLKIPNLKDRREDVGCLLDTFIRRCTGRYSRCHVITPRARRTLLDYPWEGNSVQPEVFCEWMILTIGRRTITEGYVRNLLRELYHQDNGIHASDIKGEETPEEREDHKEDNTELALLKYAPQKYNGSWTLTAKKLGISTTILQRKLKKYGLDGKQPTHRHFKFP